MKYAHIDENNKLLGWYSKEIHAELPTPIIEVSDEQWQIAIDNNHNKINNDGSTEYYNFNDTEEIIQSIPQKLEFCKKSPIGLTEMFSTTHIEYLCPRCRDYKSTPNDVFGSDYLKDIYNLRNNIPCEKCHSNCLIFEQNEFFKVLTQIIEASFFNNIYQVLGSKNSVGVALMKENEINHVYLEEMGIPENAKILDVNLTANCHLSPLKFMPNNPRFTQNIDNKILTFYPVNTSKLKKINDENKIAITVQWILLEENDISDINLLQAIDNYIDNKPYELIMNANRCLELLCNQICFKEFTKNYNSKNEEKSVNDFLVTGATYGHQLKYLLNLICKANNLILIEKELISRIDLLRKLRNDIAHKGQLKSNRELVKKEKEEILSITILGSSLMKYILNNL